MYTRRRGKSPAPAPLWRGGRAGFTPEVPWNPSSVVLSLCAAMAWTTTAIAAQTSLQSSGESRSIRVAGQERSFLLHAPAPVPGRTMPLLLVFHGAGGTAASMVRHTGLAGLAVARGYAVVHPEGVDRRWNDGRNNSATQDDIGFVRTLLDSLARQLPIDSTRIYATGISNGAAFAYRLACDLPGRFAAIAAVAGAPAAAMEDRCGLAAPVSLIAFQGTRDPLMPYEGGTATVRRGQVLSARRTAAVFAALNSCPAQPVDVFEPDSATDGTRVRRTSYEGCPEGRAVVLYSIEGGGHTWPGGPPVGRLVGRVTRDIDASRTILDFFDRHPE